jgi:hypothetical protein
MKMMRRTLAALAAGAGARRANVTGWLKAPVAGYVEY